ncbi:MAG: hypothetical protein HY427_02585 [Candidatus Levybacteria bacterium]|nr:hypothetical protein [Candidatus Levybacteria bacterium]
MKDKIVPYNSCVSIFQPNLQSSFATVSPISLISDPNTPVLYSWAGSVSYTSLPSIAFGTIDRWRPDYNDTLPLNRDQWVLWSTGTADLIRIKETQKSKIPNHWAETLPPEVQRDSPDWTNDLINELLQNKRIYED